MKILVLVGPTGIGKSAVALEIARLLTVEILSADSRQVFRFMNIGTAKPTPDQRALVPHHFVDEKDPDESFDSGMFGVEGRKRIGEIFQRGALPVVVGGSGLYIRSLLDGFFEGPGRDHGCREELERWLQREGVGPMMAELHRVDPDLVIDPTKPRRVIRALEVFRLTGIPLSVHQRTGRPVIPFTAVQVGLTCSRDIIYRRINERCQTMVEAGLIREAQELMHRGYSPDLQALHSVGYVEAFAYLRGEIGMEEMLRLFQQQTRRFAKRQLTWFRRDMRIQWLDIGHTSPAEVARGIVDMLPSTHR